MSDADTAYQIAEQRIARAKETGARVLALSPHFAEDGKQSINNAPELSALDRIPPAIADLTDLQALYLNSAQMEDISHLAGMTAMQTFNLSGTKVEDISPLAGMTAMRTLYLRSTKVEDISHLAGMTAMKRLSLDDTPADLQRLVAEGAAWAEEGRALQNLGFSSTPATQSGEC